jgi:hypothetical protein
MPPAMSAPDASASAATRLALNVAAARATWRPSRRASAIVDRLSAATQDAARPATTTTPAVAAASTTNRRRVGNRIRQARRSTESSSPPGAGAGLVAVDIGG